MSSVNKVILIGRLGKDPEVKRTQSGAAIANLSVATSQAWKDKTSGERKETTQWHRVVIFNDQLADVAERYLRKGSHVYIEGQLETRKWTDKDGAEKYATEVVLRQYGGALTLLDPKPDGAPARTGGAPAKAASGADFDDQIPF